MDTTPTSVSDSPVAPLGGLWRWRRWGGNSLLLGASLSVVLHAGAAVALLAIAGGLQSSGSSGTVYLVSLETGEGRSASGGMAAFSWSRSFPPATSKLASLPSVAISLTAQSVAPEQTSHQLAPHAQSHGSLTLSAIAARKDTAPALGGDLGASGHDRAPGANRSGRALISSPLPPYPEAARRANFQGRVLLEIRVAPSGKPEDVAVLRSSGRADCDESARNTVLTQWRFKPSAIPTTDTQRLWVRFELR